MESKLSGNYENVWLAQSYGTAYIERPRVMQHTRPGLLLEQYRVESRQNMGLASRTTRSVAGQGGTHNPNDSTRER